MFKDLKQSQILVVDDNSSNVEQLLQLLEFHGFSRVESTTDSRQVESLIKTFEPDILLLDLEEQMDEYYPSLHDLVEASLRQHLISLYMNLARS